MRGRNGFCFRLERVVGALRYRGQQVFLAHHQSGGVVAGEFEFVTVGDSVGGTRLYAVAAEDATAVVDVVDLGVALTAADAKGVRVFRGFNIDAACRARGRAQEARHTLFQPVFIALQHMLATKAFLQDSGSVGIQVRDRRLHHFLQSDAHAFDDGGCASEHFVDVRHLLIRLAH